MGALGFRYVFFRQGWLQDASVFAKRVPSWLRHAGISLGFCRDSTEVTEKGREMRNEVVYHRSRVQSVHLLLVGSTGLFRVLGPAV